MLIKKIKLRGKDPWIAEAIPSLGNFYIAPICSYVNLTKEATKGFNLPGLANWWARVQIPPSYNATEPDLG